MTGENPSARGERPLQTDWLAVDRLGRRAIFLGDDESGWPSAAELDATARVIDAVSDAFDAQTVVSSCATGYRDLGSRAEELTFDLPRLGVGIAWHDERVAGYPHLVFAKAGGERIVRQALDDLGGREVRTREGLAVVFDDLGPLTHAELHEEGACDGCRVIDDPEEPHPRSPQLLAAFGFYVYAWTKTRWSRLVSPAVSTRASEFAHDGSLVELDVDFEVEPWLTPSVLAR